MSDTQVQPSVDQALVDQNGNKSSKRIWAYRFGWATLVQISIQTIAAIAFLVAGGSFIEGGSSLKDIPQGFVEMLKFGILATLSGCCLCLGLTIPEWFAKTNSQSFNKVD